MTRRSTLEVILDQALRETAKVQTSEMEFTHLAEMLSDNLYRICVEFDVNWNTFKAAVMSAVLESSRTAVGSDNGDVALNLEAFETRVPLIIFALELISEDAEV